MFPHFPHSPLSHILSWGPCGAHQQRALLGLCPAHRAREGKGLTQAAWALSGLPHTFVAPHVSQHTDEDATSGAANRWDLHTARAGGRSGGGVPIHKPQPQAF